MSGPEESEVDIRHIAMNARDEMRHRLFRSSEHRVKPSSWWPMRRRWERTSEAELCLQETDAKHPENAR